MAPIADQFSSYQFSVKNTTGLLNTLIYIQFCMKNNLFSKKTNLHNMCRRQMSSASAASYEERILTVISEMS